MKLISTPADNYDADENRAGSSCGDNSLGAEPSTRMTWETETGTFITTTVTAFVTGRRESDEHDLDVTDHDAALVELATRPDDEDLEPVYYYVELRTEWLEHTDRDEPGSTELRSDYEYLGLATQASSLEDAEATARAVVRAVNPDHYSPEAWK